MEELVRKAVLLYNRYRSPEAVAKSVLVTPEVATLSITGSFCYSCGVLDYVEDFVHEFKLVTDKVELKVGKTRQTSPRSFEADYLVRSR
jgi:hypothetical protein